MVSAGTPARNIAVAASARSEWLGSDLRYRETQVPFSVLQRCRPEVVKDLVRQYQRKAVLRRHQVYRPTVPDPPVWLDRLIVTHPRDEPRK